MINAKAAISRARRDITVGTLIKASLISAAALCLVLGPLLGAQFNATLVLLMILVIGIVVSFRSVRGTRLGTDFPSLLARGQYDIAESRLEQSLQSFSIFKTVKLMHLHQLAMLRHAQNRWDDAAMLCRTLLNHRAGSSNGLSKSSYLMLADSLLEMGDLAGAHESLMRLYQHRLSLGEALRLLLVQLEYEHRVGATSYMLHGLESKVQLAELMSATQASRALTLLARAAADAGRQDWSRWLGERAKLLGT
jgi:hypothetical protein